MIINHKKTEFDLHMYDGYWKKNSLKASCYDNLCILVKSQINNVMNMQNVLLNYKHAKKLQVGIESHKKSESL